MMVKLDTGFYGMLTLVIVYAEKSLFYSTNYIIIKFILLGIRIICKQLPYILTPPLGQDMTQGQFLSGV